MIMMPSAQCRSVTTKAPAPRVAVVIVNYRTADQTIACVRSLQNQRYASLSIIVVDNDSRDGSAERFRNELNGVDVIASTQNGGYTGGNNIGIESALSDGADYVLVLNPDTIAISNDFIAIMVDFAESHPRTAVLGPRVHLRRIGEIQNTILEFPWLTRRIRGVVRRCLGKSTPKRSADDARQAEVLSGVCLLFRAEALFDVGLFDERTFAYIDEVDWAYRAHQGHWDLWYLPIDSVVHEQKETGYERGSTVEFLLKRNTLYFLLKNRRPFQAAIYTLSTLSLGYWHQWSGASSHRPWIGRLIRAYLGLWMGRIDEVMGRPQA
jgi:GT2 family glycosyltransferase